ncbi:MAG: iron-containing alcohol dehydrogenase [Sulfitobacter sp.]
MKPFIFNTTPSIRMGAGLLDELGDIAKSVCGDRVLVVTDPGMMATGIVKRAVACLEKAGVRATVFSEVQADPSEAVIHAAVAAAQGASGVIGLGGGSSIDVAKLAALLATGTQSLSEVYGVGMAKGARLPLIAVPTTAGTGSEVTPISIVTTGASEKMGVVSPMIIPDLALLDPELTRDLPAAVTAATGVDAMVHAIEAYASASPNNNSVSRALACEALRLMAPALERAVQVPHDMEARGDMLLGSLLAGQAFANSPVAAVHALAYPVGGHFKVPHGLSNALVLPHVIRFNAVTAPDAYARLGPIAFPELGGLETAQAAAGFADALAALSARCGLPSGLRAVGITADDVPLLARDAMNQTRLLVNNPRKVTEADARAIYTAAL